jgi:hypothetical protein
MSRLARLVREPLFHFLLTGAALFLIFGLKPGPETESSNRILVDAGEVKQLAAQFQRTWMRPPTEQELEGLVESFVRDEVYYREALALGLDKDDRVLRQRMRQKLEFIFEDLTAETPTDEQLAAYLEEHADDFAIGPRVSFQQLYLNPDDRQDLEGDARELLAILETGVEPMEAGDPSLLPFDMRLASTSEIARIFGGEFAEKMSQLEPGDWLGPVYSGLGAHVVRVTAREEGRLPGLAEVRPVVEREWLTQRRNELRELAYSRFRQGYEVVVEFADPAAEAGGDNRAARTETSTQAGTQASQ